MPISQIIEKESFQELEVSESMTVVPATDYGNNTKQIDPIVKALTSGNQNLSAVEKIIKSAGCTLVKPYGFILDNADHIVTLSELIAGFYGINTTGPVRCPVCTIPFSYDVILFHIESNYQKGHNLKPKEVTELFEQRFYNWQYRNGKFIK